MFPIQPIYANDVFSLESDTENNVLKIYSVDLITKEKTFLTEKNMGGEDPSGAGRNSYVNPNSGEIVVVTSESTQKAYNWQTNTWRTIDESLFPDAPLILQIPSVNGNGSTEVLSIGENSLKLKETSNSQEMWATDSSGSVAPINITNGTKLLINGRDVEQSINNIGAMTAALTGLPTIPTNTNLSCGLGTGTHGGDFAFSGGCASKLNEKLSINYAASITMPGQDYAGDFEDSFSARAGFVWKLGKAIKPTQISMKEKENFKSKIESLEEKNKQLLARLERLEKIALVKNESKDLAVYQLK